MNGATLADSTPEMLAAATTGHHLTLGPGTALTEAWVEAGLELPDLDAVRRYRVERTVEQLIHSRPRYSPRALEPILGFRKPAAG